jgi:hypothetical protein
MNTPAAFRWWTRSCAPRDVLRTLNEELPKAEWDRAFQNLTGRPSDAYRSAHWDEPNILAHIRLNDRTDADGKRVLFVEELQSDWAQAARKEGFKQPDTTSARREELKQQIAALVDRRAEVRRNDDGALTSEQQRVELWKLSDELERLGEEHSALTAPLTKGVPQAPFVGKTDAWLSLALRRIIKMAADEGYDRVAFVNGDQSAARYGLSQVVNRITWEPTRNQALIAVKLELEGSPWVLNVRTNDGTVASVGGGASTDLQGHSLGDIVGKEVLPHRHVTPLPPTAACPRPAPESRWERSKSIVSDLIDEGLSRAGVYRFTSPMSEGSVRARAIGAELRQRRSAWRAREWQRISDLLQKRFTPEQRRQMWEAADEQNTLLQQGQSTAGRGLERLTPGERDVVEQLHTYGEELLRARRTPACSRARGCRTGRRA